MPQLRDPNENRPEPVPGCAGCRLLDQTRERAAARGDGSAVTDANVKLRRHHAQEHAPQPS